MKKIVTDSLICMAVAVLAIALVGGITEADWTDMTFYLGLLCMGVLFSIWQIVLRQINVKLYLTETVLNFVVTFIMALALGKLFGWYSDWSNIGYVCVEILLVYVICYLLGMMNAKREVERINAALKKR